MAKLVYCWRCKIDITMLDESEWNELVPRLREGFERMKEYRKATGASFTESKDQVYGAGALERYYELTGYRETNVNGLWHHQLSLLGPECTSCGKPLRTPRAKFCAACGIPRKQ